MILTFDTYYQDNSAKTVCVCIDDWKDEQPLHIYTETITGIADYESGEFYKRELPCITSLLKKIRPLTHQDLIIVDGYVVLDDYEKYGLGGYLYQHLEQEVPIIGVAKNNFASIEHLKRIVFRGESKKPLYVTSIGFDVDEAASRVASMHGEFRMPTILKLLDQKSREL